jgi:hypothetical protein
VRLCSERGIPLNVLDGDLLEALEEARDVRLSLGDKSNLARDFMHEQAVELQEMLRREHAGADMALAFDATPWNDDLALVVSRVCTEDFRLQHRLVALKAFTNSLKAAHWERIIEDVIKFLDVPRDRVRVGLTDGCSVMVRANRDLANVLPNYISLLCLLHLWQKVPAKFDIPMATNVLSAWNAVFKNSPGARALFKKITGATYVRKHKIRWNATYGQLAQLVKVFDKLELLISELQRKKLSTKSVTALVKAT